MRLTSPRSPSLVRPPVPRDTPPAFEVEGGKAVFTDFRRTEGRLIFDVSKQQATAKVRVQFTQPEAGFPLFDLVPEATALRVDGRALPLSALGTVSDPDNTSTWRAVKTPLAPGKHVLELEYPISEGVHFAQEGVDFRVDMTDLTARRYAEQYLPSNGIFDQSSTRLDIQVVGAKASPQVLTNGTVRRSGAGHFSVTFPPYFNATMPFLHVFEPERYTQLEATFLGAKARIPVTVYSKSPEDALRGRKIALEMLAKNEQLYGPFPHAQFIAYISDTPGGMEYAGAAVTSLDALPHEITHSWFARSVMPASGNDGWLDEAVATWTSHGSARANEVADAWTDSPLAGASVYERATNRGSYGAGPRFLAELDLLFAPRGGLTPLLRTFAKQHRHKLFVTEDLERFLQSRTDIPLRPLFASRIYGTRALATPEDSLVAAHHARQR